MANKRKAVRKPRQAEPVEARALHAALDALPVGFALFDGDGKLSAWNARLAALKLFPKRLLKKGTALGAFRAYDKALSARVSRPREVELRKGVVLRAASSRVPPGHLLVTYEDVSAQKRAEGERDQARAEAREAGEGQTATTEILQVMAGAPTDVQPVFDAIARNAARLLAPASIGVSIVEGNVVNLGAVAGPLFFGDGSSWVERAKDFYPIPFDPEVSLVARAIVSGSVLEIPDVEAKGTPSRVRELYRAGGARSSTQIPLISGGKGIGAIGVAHPQPGFRLSDKQLELMKAFAAQAAIAIENVRLFNETREALERQTATAEILKVISQSPDDLTPVFGAILDRATRLCEAQLGFAFTYNGQAFELVAERGLDPERADEIKKVLYENRVPGPRTAIGTLLSTRQLVHVPDVRDTESYRIGDPLRVSTADLIGARTLLAVPLLRDGTVLGAVVIYRREVRPFADQQLALLRTFADQAVIAIENVRLFNETREALERQTATAEVLQVISSSVADTAPVFDKIIRSCEKLFGVRWANVALVRDDGLIDLVHDYGRDDLEDWEIEVRKFVHTQFPRPVGESIHGYAILKGEVLHYPDVDNGPDVPQGLRAFNDVARARFAALGRERNMSYNYSVMYAPMFWEGKGIGAIGVHRVPPAPFADKDIRLLKTFADQASIAIQNARLFNETKEALERQTATADILKVISESPTDVQPVFDAITRSAAHLFPSCITGILMKEGDQVVLHGLAGPTHIDQGEMARTFPVPFDPEKSLVARAIASCDVMQIIDSEAPDTPAAAKQAGRAVGFRSLTAAPLVREGIGIGAISVASPEAGIRLSDKQISLLRTFADQAVIAIENVRLFNETKEALEQQQAAGEILSVISSSVADTKPVFEKILESGRRLFGSDEMDVLVVDEAGQLQIAAYVGNSHDAVAATFPAPVERTPAGQAIRARRVVHWPDVIHGEDVPNVVRRVSKVAGYQSMAFAPMLWQDRGIGAIGVARARGPFSPKELAMLQTFANQAVIAIQNAQFFNDTRESLERQTATAEILRVISGSLTDVQPVFEAIAQTAHRLFNRTVALQIVRDDALHIGAVAGFSEEGLKKARSVYPMALETSNRAVRAMLEGKVLERTDVQAPGTPPVLVEIARASGFRSIVTVPLLRGEELLGQLSLNSEQVSPRLDEKQRGLLTTFADQAVIAIENVRLFNETKEALERQTATAEILKVISESPTDTQPVFDAIAESARKLFGEAEVGITLIRGDAIELVAAAGMSEERLGALRASFPRSLDLVSTVNTTVVDGQLVHYPDMLAEGVPSYTRDTVKSAGIRAMLGVPLLREGRSIGGVFLSRATPGAYSEHQIALLKTFADQAVIAIENVRLFNETKEALERQTATAEILKVISESPTDTQPVFEAIAESAARLFSSWNAAVLIRERELIHLRAARGPTLQGLAKIQAMFPIPFDPDSVLSARAITSGRFLEFPDSEGPDIPSIARELARAGGHRAIAYMPLLREGRGIGAIAMLNPNPGSRFSEHQVSLLRTFANQAVIAIENVRLFNETKEALERQTATAEILKVISESPTDVQPVFDAIARSAASLFDCKAGITILEGASIDLKAIADGNATDEVTEARFREMQKIYPLPFDPERNLVSRAIATASPIEVADTEAPGPGLSIAREVGRAGGFRSLINVPLIREGSGIGTIALAFEQPRMRLTDRQRALVHTFADQAVIAIENVRLFNELQQRTEALTQSVGQLTALGEVSQTISSTLDLEKVLPTIVSRAVQLTGLDGGAIYEYDEARETFALRAGENVRQEILELNRSEPIRIGEGAIGRAAATRQPVQVPDIAAAGARQTRGRDVLLQIGARALLAVPLLREGHILGALAVIRNTPGEFPPGVIALLETFASQSAIAIQNARLFREIEDKSRQLELASQHKSQFLASMSHELRTPLNAILGFNELILGGIYGDIADDMRPPLEQMQGSGKHLLSLINNVLDLAKIEANKMELALSDYSVQDAVGMVHSTLQSLAADKGLEFVVSVPDDLPLAHGDGGRLSQCLINLAGNAIKFTKQGRVEIGVALVDDTLRFSVADTGIGIPPDKIDSLFTEFRQTDATIASEYGGTGLGLSITKKFIEMHGGRIWVESTPGQGSTFIFEVPLRVTAGVST